jgi:hypothetical protein
MPEFWTEVLAVHNTMLRDMPYHGPLLNERYLHHFFSHRLQTAVPGIMDLLGPRDRLRLHPEWPTYKEATGIDGGKYCKSAGRYAPVDTGKKGGFVDFAVGPYPTPGIGVEFKLLFGWQAEPVTFDYVKLLDRRNPFRAVASVVVLMRPNGLAAAGRRDDIEAAISTALQDAVGRLGAQVQLTAARRQRFVVTELAPGERRHWLKSEVAPAFMEMTTVPPLQN